MKERKRIHVTETPRLASILAKHRAPGEPKATTLVRLVERLDAIAPSLGEEEFMIFDAPGPKMTGEVVSHLLEVDDADIIAAVTRG